MSSQVHGTQHFDKAKRVQQMSNASNVLRSNRGAVVRYMEKIDAMDQNDEILMPIKWKLIILANVSL